MCSRHAPLNGADSEPSRTIVLTRQQARALGAVALTGDRAAAAAQLGISSLTLRAHLALAYERLDVRSIAAAFAAIGWLDVPAELLELEPTPTDGTLVWIGGLD